MMSNSLGFVSQWSNQDHWEKIMYSYAVHKQIYRQWERVLITEHEHFKLTSFKGKIITAEEVLKNVVYTSIYLPGKSVLKTVEKIFLFFPTFLFNA